ncbi:hypothetical protein F3157_14190 [Virgibacillus dakarensis]|uniref:Uncharacterized protein n=1 Tax=Lentibacillus populi TaxID=1827502 RepID=A0A9W5X589_9BACI|nr:hypothetical protein [Lentibacillus populi]MBT2218125.1 hypothetical protein [Virgibacillus dakarensis]MTW86800.1 hypothetical protein [Virgibacillus dakarensis]GGB37339.1 hypothetical protein GCM10011409_13460 [Lentibacillus populi]
MLKQPNNESKRKYGWVEKWAKMTGERARIDAKANNTYIVYEKEGKLVKEFPNGIIIPLHKEGGS